MKKFIAHLFLATWLGMSYAAESNCFDDLPGKNGIRIDVPDEIQISKLTISNNGKYAYIATEYLGSSNVQASVYLKKNGKYCLSGILGPSLSFKSVSRGSAESIYDIEVESKSGSDKFVRRFHYSKKSGEYIISLCRVKAPKASWRRCSKSEFNG